VLEGILADIIDASLLRKAMQSCSGVDNRALVGPLRGDGCERDLVDRRRRPPTMTHGFAGGFRSIGQRRMNLRTKNEDVCRNHPMMGVGARHGMRREPACPDRRATGGGWRCWRVRATPGFAGGTVKTTVALADRFSFPRAPKYRIASKSCQRLAVGAVSAVRRPSGRM
jgi:hypothetical protein